MCYCLWLGSGICPPRTIPLGPTFSFILQEVSLKYHNITRSLIKFGFESIKKKCLLFLFYSLSCPSSGHSWTKRWASTEQATGTHCPCGVHRVPKRWAIFGHLLQVGGFAIMHDASWLSCSNWMTFFMILLWYFYDTFCKIIQNVSFFYLIMYQLFVSVFSQQDDTLILFT